MELNTQGRVRACLFAALLFLGALPAFARASEWSAPIFRWTVDNWYQSKPQWHKRWFSDPRSSFYVDWYWHAVVDDGNGPELTCEQQRQPAVRYWRPGDVHYVEDLYPGHNAYAKLDYFLVECDGSGESGPWMYPSGTKRHWNCGDGWNGDGWREPSHPEAELCEHPDDAPERDNNVGKPDCPDCVPGGTFGDPIFAATGNKFETRTEFLGEGAWPLEFSWTYNSLGGTAASNAIGDILGVKRSTTYSQSVSISTSAGVSTAYVSRPDGKASRFRLVGGLWVPTGGRTESLLASGTGWRYQDNTGRASNFDGDGRLTSIESVTGQRIAVEYDSTGRLDHAVDEAGRKLRFGYDVANRLQALTLPDGNVVTFDYTDDGVLRAVTYANGSFVTYLYDEVDYSASTSRGLLTGEIDENGKRIATTIYDASGRAIETYGPGRVADESASLTPDPSGYFNNASITEAGGAKREVTFVVKKGRILPLTIRRSCTTCATSLISYTYHDDGNAKQIVRNDVTELRSYTGGLETSRTEAAGDSQGRTRVIETDWDATGLHRTEVRRRDAALRLLRKERWTYNGRGQVLTATVTDPVLAISRTTTNTYCEQADVAARTCPRVGLLTKVDGARTDVADVTTYIYRMADAPGCDTAPMTCAYRKGDLWKVTNARSQATEILAYDGAGRILSVKDVNGVVTDTEYTERGWAKATKVRGTDDAVETDDAITRMDYWPTGLVKQITQPDGTYTTFEYDDAHRLKAIANNVGDRIEYTLDNAGNRTQEDTKDAQGTLRRTLSRIYNQLGQLQAAKDAYGYATTMTYDAAGNPDLTSDAKSRTTDSDYDPLNRLAATLQDTAGIKAQTRFGYDALDNLTSVVDPKGLTTGYTYNSLGDLTKLVSPDTGTTTYTYDSVGNLKTKLDARGSTKQATYGYDVLNRLTSVSYATTSPNLNVTYAYDTVNAVCAAGENFAIGRLTRMTDGSGSTQYCYDRFGRMVRKVQTTNGKVFTTTYQYAVSGRLLAMTYPSGLRVGYGYDAAGRPNTVKVTRPGQVQESLLSNVTYYPFGPVAELHYGNEDRVLTRQYDKNYRPILIQDSTPAGLHYLLGWDEVGNLTGLSDTAANPTISVPLRSYGYDALNRLTAANDPNNVLLQGYTYDATGNRLTDTKVTGTGTTSYTYPTTSHRLTGVGGKARTYDAMGNTLTATVNGVAKTYTYDVTGRMNVAKNGSTVVMNYAYNGKGEQVRRYPSSTSTAQTYEVYDEAGHWIGEYDSTGARKQEFIWLGDLPIGVYAPSPGSTTNFQVYQVQPDHLGTPRIVVDATRQTAVWSWPLQNEAFGNTQPNQDPDADGKAFTFDMRFPGQRYDSASGLNYNYFRDYDAGSGRYAESDPLGLLAGTSTYSYVGSSPLQFTDSLGLDKDPGCVAACTVVGSVVGGGIGYVGGGVGGAVGGGAACTLVAPGLGTVGCGGAGAVAGSSAGGVVGAGVGGVLGHYAGQAMCPDDDPCKGIRKQLEKHKQKLAEYIADPYAHDNLGKLGRGNDQAEIAWRIASLKKQIAQWERELAKCEANHGR